MKTVEAIKNHPNSRNAALGPLKHWVGTLHRSSEELRLNIKTLNGNKLADYVSGQVETASSKTGRPWKRAEPAGSKKKDDKSKFAKGTTSLNKENQSPNKSTSPAKRPEAAVDEGASSWMELEGEKLLGAKDSVMQPPRLCNIIPGAETLDMTKQGIQWTTTPTYISNYRVFHSNPPAHDLGVFLPGAAVQNAKAILEAMK